MRFFDRAIKGLFLHNKLARTQLDWGLAGLANGNLAQGPLHRTDLSLLLPQSLSAPHRAILSGPANEWAGTFNSFQEF